MWKLTVYMSALVILTVATNVIQARPTCNAVFKSCDFWGIGPGNSGPYAGYICLNQDPQRSRTGTPQPGQVVQAVDLPGYGNCGLLYTYTYDPFTQTATNLVKVPGPGCGGNQATGNCNEPPSA